MRIALAGHVRHPIAPPFAGGMEAHSWHLARVLARRGHDVTLLASGDSAEAAPPGVRVHPVMDRHYDTRYPWHRFHGTAALNAYLDDTFSQVARDLVAGGFDVVHNNSLHRFLPRLAMAERLPMVTSLHVPPFTALQRAVHDGASRWTHFTVTSRRQMDLWWPDGRVPDGASVLPNGVDLDDWPFSPTGDGSAVWSGRITPTKGTHLAVEAARIAGISLTVFGVIEHQDYFEETVKPWLDGSIRYGGHLRGAELARELGRASALLFTPLWDEPFGLAAIEAMATGLPVACVDMGAVREVVGPAGTYAPANDAAALANALVEAMAIPRTLCRERVEAHFTLDRMVDRTEALYENVRAGSSAPYPTPAFEPFKLRIASPDTRPTEAQGPAA